MVLDFDTVRRITQGAAETEEKDGGMVFHRFTAAQRRVYADTEFCRKPRTTAGVCLQFQTDATALYLRVYTTEISTRTYFAHDISVNGTVVGHLKNFSFENGMPANYPSLRFPAGEYEGTYALGDGTKTVCVRFPWSVASQLRELRLDGASFVRPVGAPKTLTLFGDSITQGYDAVFPSSHYSVPLAKALHAQIYNKAIGGDIFRPELARERDEYAPDYIVVAYGTNDWDRCERADTEKRCKDFFRALVQNYPSAEIFAITPVWRKGCDAYRAFGPFAEAEQMIRGAVAEMRTVTCIRGWDLVPHDETYFGDAVVHPNDEGFRQYAARLIERIGNRA